MDTLPDILGGSGEKKPPQFDSSQLSHFVTCYLDTGDALTAAIRAGLQNAEESILITADRVMGMPEVKSAIAVVQKLERDHARVQVTRESLVEDCQSIKERALTDRQYPSALNAVRVQADLMGISEQRIRVTHTTDLKKMSDEDLERIAGGGKIIDVSDYQEVADKG